MSEHAAVENNTLHSAQVQDRQPCYVFHLSQRRHYLTVNMWSAWVVTIAFNGIIDSALKAQCK